MARTSQATVDDELPSGKASRAVVSKVYFAEGYGFLLTPDCREVRFTKDNVLREEFERLRVGSEVQFDEIQGKNGPDAVAVSMVNTPMPDGEEPLGSLEHGPELRTDGTLESPPFVDDDVDTIAPSPGSVTPPTRSKT